MQQIRILTSALLFALFLTAVPHLRAATVNVDCNGGAAIGPILGRVKPDDVILVQGTCRENLLIPSEVLRITLDGQGKATIDAPDARRPAVQVLGREVTIKGFTVSGGTFGIDQQRRYGHYRPEHRPERCDQRARGLSQRFCSNREQHGRTESAARHSHTR